VSGSTKVGRALRIAAVALFYLALPLALIAANVRFAFSDEHVYEYSIDHYGVPDVTGISRADLIAATDDIRAYFTNDEDYLRTVVHDQDGAVVPLFNAREVLHMHDVKSLVRVIYGLGTVALIYVLAYIVCVVVWAQEESPAMLARRLLQACAGTVVALVLFGVAAFTGGFDALFVKFHELVFSNNYWQLDPARDHLVQMFPEGFWSDATLLLAVMTVVELAAISWLSYLYLRRQRTGAEVPPVAAPEPVAPASDKTVPASEPEPESASEPAQPVG